MASWAGGAGAGGASAALEQLVARQLLERKQAEIERATKAQEAQQVAELAQRAEAQRQGMGLQYAELAGRRDENYQDRTQRVGEFNSRLQRQTLEDQIRTKERGEDAGAKTADREDEQAFRSGETRSRQAFERAMLAAQQGGRATSEPLVAIKDPVTGQPTLVPRSQASGKAPASTRDQAMTEGQSNAAGFADRMKFNEPAIQGYEGSVGRGSQIQGWLPGEMQNAGFQKYQAAKKNWIASQLRKESGAAISSGEYDEADKQYFPQPGDNPELIAQKRQLRGVAEASMRRAAGHGGAPTPGMTDAPAATSTDDLGKEW